jgi:hypothetical protein
MQSSRNQDFCRLFQSTERQPLVSGISHRTTFSCGRSGLPSFRPYCCNTPTKGDPPAYNMSAATHNIRVPLVWPRLCASLFPHSASIITPATSTWEISRHPDDNAIKARDKVSCYPIRHRGLLIDNKWALGRFRPWRRWCRLRIRSRWRFEEPSARTHFDACVGVCGVTYEPSDWYDQSIG